MKKLGQRPQMTKVRGYVAVYLTADEWQDIYDALSLAGRSKRRVLRDRVAIARNWADAP